MDFTTNTFKLMAIVAVFGLLAAAGTAAYAGQKLKAEKLSKTVNPAQLNNRLNPAAGTTVSSQGAKDPNKCPEKTPGGGAGEVSGGMCHYSPRPAGGCSTLGTDCSNSTLKGKETCRCSPKDGVTSGLPDPGQVQGLGN